ncbi:MAG: hypothetical protein WCP97_00655 [bacterium]
MTLFKIVEQTVNPTTGEVFELASMTDSELASEAQATNELLKLLELHKKKLQNFMMQRVGDDDQLIVNNRYRFVIRQATRYDYPVTKLQEILTDKLAVFVKADTKAINALLEDENQPIELKDAIKRIQVKKALGEPYAMLIDEEAAKKHLKE